jgi:hypothetical protein
MNDCTRISPLLEVYADDEASPETNAIVLDHLQRCDRCARELRGIQSLRTGLRAALGDGRAPAALAGRIVSAIDGRPRRWLPAAVRAWLVPASAALIALAIWMAREQPADAHVQTAVSEHVICALQGRGPRLPDAAAAERGLGTAMPWIRDGAAGIRIVEAHTCGGAQPFAHVVLDIEGSTASVLIARRPAKAVLPAGPLVRGDFEVSVVTSARHVAYVIADRRRREGNRALRGPTLQRVERFLQQMEGRS